MRFRKKPVEIEATPIRGVMAAADRDWMSLPDWVREAYDTGKIAITVEGVYVETLEGQMLGRPDDMLIQGISGELYPCKPDVFRLTYDEVVAV